MKIRRKVPKGMNGVRRKLDSGENKSMSELVPAAIRSKFQGLKRKLDSGEDYHTKPEVLQTKINTSNTVEVDSDSEVVFNVPQAKKLKTDPEVIEGIPNIEPKPQLKLNIDAAKTLGQSVLQGENSAKILGQTVLQGESAEEIKPRRSPNGYLLSDPLPQGLVLKDLRKKTWKLGKSIGLGGFGEIYAAALLDGKTLSEEDYVVKVEPHNNGPLFVELHFYCRATKKEDLDNFAAKKNIKHLGVPDLKGHGSFIHRKKKLRFIVMPRYGTDLQTKIDESKSKCLSLESTSHLATQIIDSLEYLHSQGYVHKDLKANNMIFTRDQKGMNDKLFLVDFGLASRYLHLGIHRPFEPDQRSAHEGTLEYVSRDGHLGCVSRRGDMECLLYVIIEWLGGHLPWDTDDDERLKPDIIHRMKIGAFHDIKEFLKDKAFKDKTYPPVMEEMMTYISKMDFDEEPDYKHFRDLFRPYLPANIDNSDDVEMGENNNKENIQSKQLPAIAEDEEISFKSPTIMQKKPSNMVEKRRVLPLVMKRQQSVSRPWGPKEMQIYNEEKTAIITVKNEESLLSPTPQMTSVLKRIEDRKNGALSSVFFRSRRKGGTHFGSPARRKAGMRKNSVTESQNGDALRGVAVKPQLKAKGHHTFEAPKDSQSVRRSPRSTVQSKTAGNGNTSLGQHLYGITASGIGAVTRLVNSMFFAPTKLRPRKQQKSG